MKKHSLLLVLLALLAAGLLCSCAGAGDWAFTGLPGNYEIWRLNASEIALVERTGDNIADSVVGPYVCAVAWNEDYILARQKPERNSPEEESVCYLVTVSSGTVDGPYTEAELQIQLDRLHIPLTGGDWVDVLQLRP